jgi:sporulation protein YlmC with PRC-barrel domain
MEELAGWIAPAATMIAAMMTAANLGARVTGWGFVVFAIGSLCWGFIGWREGQANLLLTNIFLTLVNLVGIWRWLGRRAAYEDAAGATEQASRSLPMPTLFAASGLSDRKVIDRDGRDLGHVAAAMAEEEGGRLVYLVVRSSGAGVLDEVLRAVRWSRVQIEPEAVRLMMPARRFARIRPLSGERWPLGC